FSYVRIQVIHQATKSRFLMPSFAAQLRAAWSMDYSVTHGSYSSSYSSSSIDRQRLRNQRAISVCVNFSSSPESSQTPAHLSHVSMGTSSIKISFNVPPSQRGHFIDEVPASFA